MVSTGDMGRLSLHTFFALLTLAAAGLAGCATTAPAAARFATGNEALDYYPLLLKWGWAFEIERDGNKILAPYAVVGRTADLAVVKNVNDSISYAILPDGIARQEGAALGDFLLRVPVRKGATWPVQSGEAKVVETGASVTLPSGTYRDCAVVEEIRRAPDRVTRTTYCRGTGPVEIEMQVFDPSAKSYQTIAHARLLSVTRPEAEP